MTPLVNCPGCFLLRQYLAALIVSPGCKVSNRRIPRLSQKTVPIIFFADRMTLNFFATGEDGCFHVIESCFVSGVQWCNQVSSPVTMLSRKVTSYPRKSPRALAVCPWALGELLLLLKSSLQMSNLCSL
ncbi:hypothetical protein ElyMa_002069500 [Elysia marginata]|uniref:Uncharacterized protein n=1 Tax=Elysia marginata TaxID=1093978 RepID=A0AAV4FBE5_9GAST|nr:hypothetical protein ElyMa_002069500 [Elysia marginata]